MSVSKSQLVQRDKLAFHTSLAEQAQKASLEDDVAGSFRIIRILAGNKSRSLRAVEDVNGEILIMPKEVDARWTNHFASVFCADVVPLRSLDPPPTSFPNMSPILFDICDTCSLDKQINECI